MENAPDRPAARGSHTTGSLAERALLAHLRAGRAVRFVARGGSMWPAIRSGALVEVTPCDPAGLRVGDVAAYDVGGALVVHRVAARAQGALVFRGDALPRDDAPVPLAAVLGRARVVRQRALRWRVPTARDVARVALALRALVAVAARRARART